MQVSNYKRQVFTFISVFSVCVCAYSCMFMCVCVKTPRNTVLPLPNSPRWKQWRPQFFRFMSLQSFRFRCLQNSRIFPFSILQQGGSESHSIHCPTKTVVWDCDIDLEDVPANLNFLNCWQAVTIRCLLANFDCSPIDSRPTFDTCPFDFRRIFDHFPWVSGWTFDQFPISFKLHFDELRQLGLRLLPDDRLFRTNFNVCVNRGLWDNLSLPRTTPDKHVELSSVCVSPPGATSSRLDGPSEKVPVRKPQLMFPNGIREAFVPWIKGRTAGPLSHYSQSGTRI